LLLDAVSLFVGPNNVLRETVVLADPSNASYLATVNAAGALNVSDAAVDACITANVLAVSLPAATVITLTPPSASTVAAAIAADLLIGTQTAALSLPVALPTATITTLTPPSAAAIAAAIVFNPPTISIVGNVGVTQSTLPWIVAGTLAHNNAAPSATEIGVLSALANASAPTFTEGKQVLLSTDLAGNLRTTGTFTGTITGAVTIASGGVASGAIASGAIAAGAIVSGAAVSGAFADGAIVTLGSKTDAKNSATDGTSVTIMQVLKEISAMEQAPASTPVTNVGTFAVQAVPGLPTTAATVRTNGNTSSSGWTSIVAAGGGSQTVRLWRLMVSVSAATNIEIGDGTNVFLGPYYLTADGSIVLDISGEPWCVTGANAALQINNSNAVAITYTAWTTQS